MSTMCSLKELLRMRAQAEVKGEWARVGELDHALLERGFTAHERCMKPIYEQIKAEVLNEG